FESDTAPYEYSEEGFARLDRAVSWCARHGIYAILDLHSVQGWQNTDWHCDNGSRHTLFWRDRTYQDRFVALWREIARRYRGNAAVAGYNVMNEPVTNAPSGRFGRPYRPDWGVINAVYRRVVEAIREIDPEHLIFLEGDYFSNYFSGLEAPFAPNLVYSSHNYNSAGFGPGPYPGTIKGTEWNRRKQTEVFAAHQGTRFAMEHRVPLWVGEFGSVFNGPAGEVPDRLRALDDQIAVFDEHGAHWTTWTYKDAGVMGWVTLDPESEYLQRLKDLARCKAELGTDFWVGWLPAGRVGRSVEALAAEIAGIINDPEVVTPESAVYLKQAVLDNFVGGLLQPLYAKAFKGLSEEALDRVLQSFALRNCRINEGLVGVIRKHLGVMPPS
ncbi:MAG: glycoside hydrolase family 5 protein, partial [Bacteroidota bacterium]